MRSPIKSWRATNIIREAKNAFREANATAHRTS